MKSALKQRLAISHVSNLLNLSYCLYIQYKEDSGENDVCYFYAIIF